MIFQTYRLMDPTEFIIWNIKGSTTSGCKDIGIIKSGFVVRSQFPCSKLGLMMIILAEMFRLLILLSLLLSTDNPAVGLHWNNQFLIKIYLNKSWLELIALISYLIVDRLMFYSVKQMKKFQFLISFFLLIILASRDKFFQYYSYLPSFREQ